MSRLVTYSMVAVIVMMISALIFFKFEGDIREIYEKSTAKQTCKSSVQMHAKLKLRYADFSGDIKCPAVKLKINDKNEETAKKKLANAMFDCWDQFGSGKLELFAGDSVYCHVCHRITFDKDVKISGFSNYLASNNAPNQKISYLQFLTTENTPNADFLKELENKKIEDVIDASKNNEYAIVFTYIKGKKYLEEYMEKAKYTAPGVGVIALGFGIFKLGGVVGGGLSAIATPAVGVPIGGIISSFGALTMAVGALWTGLAGYFATVPFEHIALTSFIPYDAQHLQSLNCKGLPIK